MGMCPNMQGRVWHQADHPAIQVIPVLGFAAILGNSVFTCFGHAASKALLLFLDVTSSEGAMTSCVTSWHCTCTGHMTFSYKRSADASFRALLALFSSFVSWFVLQVCPCHTCMAGV